MTVRELLTYIESVKPCSVKQTGRRPVCSVSRSGYAARRPWRLKGGRV